MKYDLNALDAALAAKIEEKKLPGVSVCIRGREGVIFEKGYGMGDLEGNRPIDEHTVFGIASMSKSTTTLALCILAAEGKMSFDDPVVKYFPNFRVPGTPVESVCVKHLATHTAGIPPMEPLEWSIAMNTAERAESEWCREMRRTAPNKMDEIGQIIDYIANCEYKTLGAPGEVMSYSNEGYAILSYIADIAAGMPLEEFLQRRVFGPIGMTRTVLDEDASHAKKLAGGNMTRLFERDENGVFTADDCWSILPPFRGCACVKSTAHDMGRYYQCLADGGVIDGVQAIPARAAELLTGPAFPEEEKPFYCFGLNKRTRHGHVICEHAGGLHGVSTFGGLLKGEGFGFAALCNEGDQDTDDLTWMMYNMIMGRPLEEDHRWLRPSGNAFSAPEMLAGSYICHEGLPSTLRVFMENGELRMEDGNGPLTPVHCDGTWFQGWRDGKLANRMHFYVRNGQAWAVKVGSRVWERMGG